MTLRSGRSPHRSRHDKEKEKGQAPQAGGRQIDAPDQTTIDFGEDGIPLERLGEIAKLMKDRHLGAKSKVEPGFVPIPFDRYVDLHFESNPSVDRAEFDCRLRQAVDLRKAGAHCACGAFIWAIGSAEAGAAGFTCITGEAWPDSDYEIDEALGVSRQNDVRPEIVDGATGPSTLGVSRRSDGCCDPIRSVDASRLLESFASLRVAM